MNQQFLGVVGIAAILAIAYLFSTDRKAIRLRVVGAAFALQAQIAVIVLSTDLGRAGIEGMSMVVADLLGYAGKGTEFLFGPSAKNPLANTFAIAAPSLTARPESMECAASWVNNREARIRIAIWASLSCTA